MTIFFIIHILIFPLLRITVMVLLNVGFYFAKLFLSKFNQLFFMTLSSTFQTYFVFFHILEQILNVFTNLLYVLKPGLKSSFIFCLDLNCLFFIDLFWRKFGFDLTIWFFLPFTISWSNRDPIFYIFKKALSELCDLQLRNSRRRAVYIFLELIKLFHDFYLL